MTMIKIETAAVRGAIAELVTLLPDALDVEDWDRIESTSSIITQMSEGLTTPGREVQGDGSKD